MLTLTVDRLVGNSGGGGTGHVVHSLSMISSSSTGDCPSPPSESPSPPSKPSTPPTPTSHFSKIALLIRPLNENSSDPLTSSCVSSPNPDSETSIVKLEVGREGEGDVASPSSGISSKIPNWCNNISREGCQDKNRLTNNSNNSNSDNRNDEFIVVDEESGGDESPLMLRCRSVVSGPNQLHLPIPSSPPSRILKFSIHDILRPDFGQRAITRQSHQTPIIDNSRHETIKNNIRLTKQRNGGSGRSSSVISRSSSVKTHSEDSNSSCSSSRRGEEVVDEAKVNPEVPNGPLLWPAWVYCTRYSDRPSSGPRSRRVRNKPSEGGSPRSSDGGSDEKRPRTAFTAEQLGKLRQEFDENRYLTEKRRQDLARDLKLHENQIKIWFQNKRAKLKKSTGQRGGLAVQLMAQGLYNHSTVPMDEDDDYLPC